MVVKLFIIFLIITQFSSILSSFTSELSDTLAILQLLLIVALVLKPTLTAIDDGREVMRAMFYILQMNK